MDKPTHDAAPVKGTTQVRQGETSGRMRFVLLGSLVLVILLFALAAVFMSRI